MELLLTLIKLISSPRLDATALRTKVAFLEDKFVLSRAEASPDDMILMRRRFVALRFTAATKWPSSSSLPSVSSVALGEDDDLIPEQIGLSQPPFGREIVDDASVQHLCGHEHPEYYEPVKRSVKGPPLNIVQCQKKCAQIFS